MFPSPLLIYWYIKNFQQNCEIIVVIPFFKIMKLYCPLIQLVYSILISNF